MAMSKNVVEEVQATMAGAEGIHHKRLNSFFGSTAIMASHVLKPSWLPMFSGIIEPVFMLNFCLVAFWLPTFSSHHGFPCVSMPLSLYVIGASGHKADHIAHSQWQGSTNS